MRATVASCTDLAMDTCLPSAPHVSFPRVRTRHFFFSFQLHTSLLTKGYNLGIRFLGGQALGTELDQESVQFCHVPLPPRRGGGWSLNQSPVASNLVSHVSYVMEFL